MHADALVRGWLLLVALSVMTTALTVTETHGSARIAAAAGVLVLAGFKARLILARYLGLARSRFWMGTFDLALGGLIALAFVIYLIGTGS